MNPCLIDTAREFIRDEIFTTRTVLSEYLHTTTELTDQVLYSLVKDKLVKHVVTPFCETQVHVYAITKRGAMDGKYKPFKRLSNIRVEHTLDMQRVRAHVKWLKWQSEHWFPRGWAIKPDARAVTVTKQGEKLVVGVEIERHRKNPKRYRGIALRHLDNVRSNRYQYVMYFCPSSQETETLQRIFQGVGAHIGIDVDLFFGFYKYPFGGFEYGKK